MPRRPALTVAATVTAALGLAGVAFVAGPVTASHTSAADPGQEAVQPPTAPAPPPAPEPPARPIQHLTIERMTPSAGTFGTGITVRVHFTRPVPEEARDAVTSQIRVRTSTDVGPAGWAWLDDDTAVYRPKEFWPAGTQVSVTTEPGSTIIPTDGSSDLRWMGKEQRSFSIGRSQVVEVDADTHLATVTRNGEVVRTMPVSLGKEGWTTRSGVKTLMESYEVKEMTGASIGAEEDYTLQVPYAIRLTDTGEFIHGAPWAQGNLGRVNGSHGCTNLSVADARWLYEHHLVGDPVVTSGTGRGIDASNGTGAVWNVPWSTWLTGSMG
jgi:lipoprotein-anchoring transpeptidase ErfK/SrfK